MYITNIVRYITHMAYNEHDVRYMHLLRILRAIVRYKPVILIKILKAKIKLKSSSKKFISILIFWNS